MQCIFAVYNIVFSICICLPNAQKCYILHFEIAHFEELCLSSWDFSVELLACLAILSSNYVIP